MSEIYGETREDTDIINCFWILGLPLTYQPFVPVIIVSVFDIYFSCLPRPPLFEVSLLVHPSNSIHIHRRHPFCTFINELSEREISIFSCVPCALDSTWRRGQGKACPSHGDSHQASILSGRLRWDITAATQIIHDKRITFLNVL